MTGDTITQSATLCGTTTVTADRAPATLSRAARELELKRGEFDLAVLLGHIRTVRDGTGGRRRVPREEIERVRATQGFPEVLRRQIEAVGTAEGAKILDITTARFTRLARAGLLIPVKFYLNRYRAVVWLYLAEELRHFADNDANSPLLSGRTPDALRAQLRDGLDLRARNWRDRRTEFLLRQSADAWERAAAMASLLDPVQVAEIVEDPYERVYLNRLKPEPLTSSSPASPSAAVIEKIITADDPDEIRRLRSHLTLSLAQARAQRPAPRPGSGPAPRLLVEPWPPAEPNSQAEEQPWRERGEETEGRQEADQPRGLLKWLRRKRR